LIERVDLDRLEFTTIDDPYRPLDLGRKVQLWLGLPNGMRCTPLSCGDAARQALLHEGLARVAMEAFLLGRSAATTHPLLLRQLRSARRTLLGREGRHGNGRQEREGQAQTPHGRSSFRNG
jgi:hypothetical protein